jgi:hypothetical protein
MMACGVNEGLALHVIVYLRCLWDIFESIVIND